MNKSFPARFRSSAHYLDWVNGRENPIPTHIRQDGRTVINPEWQSAPFENAMVMGPKSIQSKGKPSKKRSK